MGDLSRNFSRSEFACPCCGRAEIGESLVVALQELRDLHGLPITVLSGYRCSEHNAAVGGAMNSRHVAGRAADVVLRGTSVWEAFETAVQVQAFRRGGIGVYDGGFLHVDVRPGRARWVRVGGSYHPLEALLGTA